MPEMHPEFAKYRKKLERLGNEAFPRIVAEAINSVASFAHAGSIANVRRRFQLRNRYTENSVRFLKANPKKDWMRINAITGSISPYMDEQDQGGFRLPKSGSFAPEPMLAARGGNRGYVVRKRYKAGTLGPNQFIGVPKGQFRGSRRVQGVYERRNRNRRLALIRKISELKVRIEAKHWHTDAMKDRATSGRVSAEFVKQAQAELRRLGAT